MKGKRSQGAYVQARNLLVTTAGTKMAIIVAGKLHDSAVDTRGLHPMLAAVQANRDAAGIDQRMRVAMADTGFFSHENNITPTEPILLLGTKEGSDYAGRPSKTLTAAMKSARTMTARRKNPAGRCLYGRRSAMVEPVFAHLFQHGGRMLHHRGASADTQVTIMLTGYNIAKLLKSRGQRNLHGRLPNRRLSSRLLRDSHDTPSQVPP
jgi:hypothetical protein